MEREDKSIARFPPPPSHYKYFTSPHTLDPPDINVISQLNSFKTFGTEYNLKDILTFYNPVDVQLLKDIPKSSIESSQNIPFFENINNNKIDQNQKYLNIKENFNVIKELENETKFIKEHFKKLLTLLCKDYAQCENECLLIGISFQKIYFYLSMLKRRQNLHELAEYFKNEIRKNEQIEKQINANIQNFHKMLINESNRMKQQLQDTNEDIYMNPL